MRELKGADFVNITTAMVWIFALIQFVDGGYKAPTWFVDGWDSVFGITIITYGGTKAWKRIRTPKAEVESVASGG